MTKSSEQLVKRRKKNFFEIFSEIIGWLQIVASPFLLFGIIGFLVYVSEPTLKRLIAGIAIGLFGLIIGIIWATRKWKKQGTVHFVSRVMASPELDNIDEEKENGKQL